MIKKYSLFIFALLSFISSSASVEIDGIRYNLKSDTKEAEVTAKPGGYSGNIVIPSTITYNNFIYNVTSIGSNAIWGNHTIESVTIPNSITRMGECAFADAIGLEKVIVSDIAAWCNISFELGANPLVEAHHLYSDENTEITDLIIPEGVTRISKEAFFYCTALNSVTIPQSVKSIKDYAFSHCNNLNSVNFSEGLIRIGEGAFQLCSNLKTITMPTSLTSIEENAFYCCTSLEKIIVKDIGAWCNISFARYGNPLSYAKHLYSNEDTEVTDLVIPNSITDISAYAFYDCIGLTSVAISDNVNSIGSYAFRGCTNLATITVHDHLTKMGSSVFEETAWYDSQSDGLVYLGNVIYTYKGTMKNNTKMILPDNTTGIADKAFNGCTSLVSIYIPNGVSYIGENAFEGCQNLVSVTMYSETPIQISQNVFDNYSSMVLHVPSGSGESYETADNWKDFNEIYEISLNAISFVDEHVRIICTTNWDTNNDGEFDIDEAASVTELGGVFTNDEEITNFTEFQYFTGLSSIIGAEFCGCSGLTTITIPNSVTSINGSAFVNCTALESIQVESGNSVYDSRNNCNAIIETASNKLVRGCQNTIIPNSVTCIGNSAFKGSGDKETIILPNSITSIGDNAFENCGLTSIIIPNSVMEIGDEAFYGCLLTSINIPNSVTKIGNWSFAGCQNLSSINIPSSITYVGEGAFGGTAWIKNQPSGIVYLGDILYAYKGTMPEGTHIDIREGTTTIATTAFEESVNEDEHPLISVTIPSSLKYINDGAFAGCTNLNSVKIPNNGVSVIGYGAFWGCSSLTSIDIPSSLTFIAHDAFHDCPLNSVYCSAINVPETEENVFNTSLISSGTLYVADESIETYRSTAPWSNFGTITSINEDISIGSAGAATFCSEYSLDFTNASGIKAYIVSSFNPSTCQVRLRKVQGRIPANTGLVLIGEAGEYKVPKTASGSVSSNMLVGVTEATVLSKIVGENTNYILGKKNGETGFFAVEDGSTLAAGKAYLPLPTASVPDGAEARRISFVFDDEEVNAISDNKKARMKTTVVYNLRGQRVKSPSKGLYVVDGRKIFVK